MLKRAEVQQGRGRLLLVQTSRNQAHLYIIKNKCSFAFCTFSQLLHKKVTERKRGKRSNLGSDEYHQSKNQRLLQLPLVCKKLAMTAASQYETSDGYRYVKLALSVTTTASFLSTSCLYIQRKKSCTQQRLYYVNYLLLFCN